MGNAIKATQANNKTHAALKLLVVLLLVLTIVPIIPGTASEVGAVEIGESTDLVSAADLGGTQVYFGAYGTSPILWHVVATDTGTATLWTTTSMGDRQYDPSAHNDWSGSDIAAWLNDTDSYTGAGFLQTALSTAEQNVVIDYSNTPEQGGSGSSFTPNQKVVLPSVAEIGDTTSTGTWGIPYTSSTDEKRGFGDVWWLRSPGAHSDLAAIIFPDGYVDAYGGPVSLSCAVRPALKLDLSSVLFTSSTSATSGKSSVDIVDGLTKATTPTGAVNSPS